MASLLNSSCAAWIDESQVYKVTASPCRASLVAQLVKNLPAIRETWVQSLGWEDPLAWRIPWTI